MPDISYTVAETEGGRYQVRRESSFSDRNVVLMHFSKREDAERAAARLEERASRLMVQALAQDDLAIETLRLEERSTKALEEIAKALAILIQRIDIWGQRLR